MKISIYTVLIIVSTSLSSFGQGGTQFAVLSGVGLQNITGKDFEGDKLKNDMVIGVHVGVNAQIPIAPEFYFQPGLLFATKGAIDKTDNIKFRYSLSYLEVPLHVVYKAPLGTGYFMLGFGPYIAYAMNGKVTSEIESVKVETDIKFQNKVEASETLDAVYFKRMGAGASIFVGYEFANGIFLTFNTQVGLLNLHPEYPAIEDDKSLVQHAGFGLSLGFRF
jgi:hypothetical protein